MGSVYGDTKSLRASDRSALEKLTTQRTSAHELLGADLAKRAAKVCANLGLQVGLLIGRDGRVHQVVLGGRDRIYLPNLGRYRLDAARLRRLRLVVFVPAGQHNLKHHERRSFVFSKSKRNGAKRGATSKKKKKSGILSPEIAGDLLTDLIKLRFDAVVVVAVENDGNPAQISLAYLNPGSDNKKSSGIASERGRQIAFYHASDVHEIDVDFELFIGDLETRFKASRQKGYDTSEDHAVLVGAYTSSMKEAQASMAELCELALTAEIHVLDTVIQRRRSLDPKTVIGKGKLEDLVLHCLDLGADLLIFDRELSPGQLRSVTNLTELRVIDRSMLILDIFAQRAKTSEGRLQVELAQLKYALPRLTERDTGLSRLTGGIGGRGPGETKLEISRRRSRDRISDLEKRIERLAQQRGLRRERRQSRGVPVIAIVGYTNAGKSTLLNALTKGEVLAESKLFATLDPSSRRMRFPNDEEVVFVDTVGFIRELPAELVAAFRATLEEVGEADLLVHVVDASNHDMRHQIQVVDGTLSDLGFAEKPQILVLNKTDILSPLEVKALQNTLGGLAVSATEREGFEELIAEVQKRLLESFRGQDPGRFTELPQGG